jgi:hypothetical protein
MDVLAVIHNSVILCIASTILHLFNQDRNSNDVSDNTWWAGDSTSFYSPLDYVEKFHLEHYKNSISAYQICDFKFFNNSSLLNAHCSPQPVF